MSQRLLCCCDTTPPPPPSDCCVSGSSLPSSVSVDVTYTGRTTRPTFVPSQIDPETGRPRCGSDSCVPWERGFDVSFDYTITGNLILHRIPGTCEYVPKGTSSYECDSLDFGSLQFPRSYQRILSVVYRADKFGTTGLASGCFGYEPDALRWAGCLVWARLFRDANNNAGLFPPGNPNNATSCACWRLEVVAGAILLDEIPFRCGTLPSIPYDRVWNEVMNVSKLDDSDDFFRNDGDLLPMVSGQQTHLTDPSQSGPICDSRAIDPRQELSRQSTVEVQPGSSPPVWLNSTLRGTYAKTINGYCQGTVDNTYPLVTASVS